MDDRVLLGRRIKELRKARGLSQEALAEKMDGHPKYLGSVERGEQNPTIEFLMKLATAPQGRSGISLQLPVAENERGGTEAKASRDGRQGRPRTTPRSPRPDEGPRNLGPTGQRTRQEAPGAMQTAPDG